MNYNSATSTVTKSSELENSMVSVAEIKTQNFADYNETARLRLLLKSFLTE